MRAFISIIARMNQTCVVIIKTYMFITSKHGLVPMQFCSPICNGCYYHGIFCITDTWPIKRERYQNQASGCPSTRPLQTKNWFTSVLSWCKWEKHCRQIPQFHLSVELLCCFSAAIVSTPNPSRLCFSYFHSLGCAYFLVWHSTSLVYSIFNEFRLFFSLKRIIYVFYFFRAGFLVRRILYENKRQNNALHLIRDSYVQLENQLLTSEMT